MSIFDVSLSVENAAHTLANVFLIIGGVLVLAGTIILFWSDGIRSKYEDERITAAELETARAREAAAEAAERAVALEKQTTEWGAKIAQANAQAAEANQKAEQERLARVKLEARLAPRSLSQEQKRTLTEKLKIFAPQLYDIIWYNDDKESLRFAEDVFATLKSAGWRINPSREALGFGLVLGIVVEYAPSKAKAFAPAARVFCGLRGGSLMVACSCNPLLLHVF